VAAVPAVRLELAGEWYSDAEREATMSLISRLGVGDRVSFRGRVGPDDKARFLSDADVFVFPGYQPEGLPLVIVEALAAGLPVIATPVGTVPDVIREDVDGIIVPTRDTAALAAAIGSLASDPERRRRLGLAGRARFEETLAERSATDRLAALLDSALAEVDG
jgi:glycosyltransferase involved in cell wall biosynthesis